MKIESNNILIRKLKEGDTTALETIYKLYYSKLFAFAKKFCDSTLEPNDFVHQTFLRLWDNRYQLKEEILFDKQLFIISRNLILNHLKREQSKIKLDIEIPDEITEENFINQERMEKIKSLITQMPNQRKEIYKMHKLKNLSYDEIANFFGVTKKTIANHIYLANLFLKANLNNQKF